LYLVPETREPINAHINKDIKIVTLSHNEIFLTGTLQNIGKKESRLLRKNRRNLRKKTAEFRIGLQNGGQNEVGQEEAEYWT
jgi:hypothetical protein